MSLLLEFARRPVPWLIGEGPERDIVLSCRVRLARNLEGQLFPHAVDEDGLEPLRERVDSAAQELALLRGAHRLNMEDLEELERRFLLERHLISIDLVRNMIGRGLMVGCDEAIGLMINEEDHVRLQVFAPGLDLESALSRALTVVTALHGEIPFAFHEELGFLTACPTNVGTGMRASILMHLPGLALTGDIDKVLNGLRRLNYTVRGFYGEGSGVIGSLFQVSNTVTLGQSELEIVENLLRHVRKVIDVERGARAALLEHGRARLEDQVWRSYGVLQHARLMTTKEAFERLSSVRLGASLGILPRLDESALNVLLINVQSAHLQVMAGRAMPASERDEARAEYVREQLGRAVERNDES